MKELGYITDPLDISDREWDRCPNAAHQSPDPVPVSWRWLERCLPYVPNAEGDLHWFIPYSRYE